ncbi:MAG: SRPBCC family protein [Candidatus Symbiobacter sp.]|nr:SRPBCC family protein [Candidatus Symbiobacter sp.]
MILITLIGAALLVGLAVLLVTAPSRFRVERKIVINAAADKIFPYLHDLRKTGLWVPYEKLDPNMVRNYSGPASGVGAKYEWDSKLKSAGAGTQEIIAVEENRLVRIKIQFFRPFPGINQIEYKLTPQNDGTAASWSMTGAMNIMSKIVCLFMPMDKMLGRQFAKGLASLKDLVEKN